VEADSGEEDSEVEFVWVAARVFDDEEGRWREGVLFLSYSFVCTRVD